MIIYLGEPLLTRSSSLPESHSAAGRHCFLFGLASGGVYLANGVTSDAGELLPHRFTLTTQRLRTNARSAVCFLWHCP